MLFALFILNTTLLALALLNFATMRKPSRAREIGESVAILLPVRNEEANIERILGELTSQELLPHYRVIVINDGSSDRTLELASSITSPHLTVTTAPELPSGWVGKVGALHHGLSLATDSRYIITVDADVSFEKDAIARALVTLRDLHLDFISPYPRQIALTWSERLIQPLLQWSWMSTLFLRGAEKFPLQSTVVANGQFMAIRTQALIASGGFEAIAPQVLDDIELGRSLLRSGFRGTVVDGTELAATRMYSSFTELRAGYGKSLHLAFGGAIGVIFTALLFAATSIIPLIYLFTGNLFAIAALMAIIGSRVIASVSSSSRMSDSLLHPASAALMIYLLYYSWRNRRVAQWKGRTL
jgi:cellulose synthase/poly-beta-1,6-N-acetylglucosamine synthase-like glycosyltransferase